MVEQKKSRKSDDDFLVAIGQVLAEERIKAGLTQEEAARAAGLQRSYLARAELGTSMALKNLSKLAAGLGLELSAVLKQAEKRTYRRHGSESKKKDAGKKK